MPLILSKSNKPQQERTQPMKTITLQTYSAEELKAEHPDSFHRAHEKFQQRQYEHGLDWGAEMIDSLKKAVELAGYRLRNWELGYTSNRNNHIELDERDCDDLKGKRAIAWLENNLLSKLRDKKGELDPCKLTGYCFDYDIIESLQKSVKGGDTIKEAFRELAEVYARYADAEWEHQLSEERFIEDSELNEVMFFEDGREV